MGVLSNLVIAVSGNLPCAPKQIKKWVNNNDGQWTTRVTKDSNITHLIASEDSWKARTEAVRKASKLGVSIVSYDWLEDSLFRKRKLSEKNYTWEYLRERKKKQKKMKKLGPRIDGMSKPSAIPRRSKKSSSFFFPNQPLPDLPFDSATEALKQKWAERDMARKADVASGNTAQSPVDLECKAESSLSPMNPSKPSPEKTNSLSLVESTPEIIVEKNAKIPHIKDLYHYYQDSTGFEYKIVLERDDLLSNCFARYQIGLLESHAKPHTFCAVIQYSPSVQSAPEPSSINDSVPKTRIRNPLLNFLAKAEYDRKQTAGHNSTGNGVEFLPVSKQSPPVIPQNATHGETDQARLISLITPATPFANTPYKALICPMNSSFSDAWRAFRHAFRDVTLLNWEERFSNDIQKHRAKKMEIEPFIWENKPEKGLSDGLFPQELGLFHGSTFVLEVNCEAEDGYTRNSFNLPGISHPLSENGTIGKELWEEEEERKKEEEERLKEEAEKEKKRKREANPAKPKRINYNKPFFNGVTGIPTKDSYLPKKSNVGAVNYTVMNKRRKPFPRELEWE